MKQIKTEPILQIETNITGFSPTQEQIDAFARRLMPEIKKYFADERIQREFADWQAKQNMAESA